jgi:hypothetical protein
MVEFLLTLVTLMLVGFWVGVGVLIYQENPRVAAFLKARPIIGCVAAAVSGGLAIYVSFYLIMLAVLALISLVLGGHGSVPTQ